MQASARFATFAVFILSCVLGLALAVALIYTESGFEQETLGLTLDVLRLGCSTLVFAVFLGVLYKVNRDTRTLERSSWNHRLDLEEAERSYRASERIVALAAMSAQMLFVGVALVPPANEFTNVAIAAGPVLVMLGSIYAMHSCASSQTAFYLGLRYAANRAA